MWTNLTNWDFKFEIYMIDHILFQHSRICCVCACLYN